MSECIIQPDQIVWDDIIQPLTGKKIDTSVGKLDYDWADKCINIADSTSIANDTHKLHFAYQIEHRFKLDGEARPHIHWLQASSDIPNWWMRWRFVQNGYAVGSWTSVALDTQVFTYSSGTILQISKPTSAIIDFTTASGGQLGVLDFIDVEVTRDISNASSLFSGSDPLSGDAQLKAFDMHLQVSSNGSDREYDKT